jgi:hypothetical protein
MHLDKERVKIIWENLHSWKLKPHNVSLDILNRALGILNEDNQFYPIIKNALDSYKEQIDKHISFKNSCRAFSNI